MNLCALILSEKSALNYRTFCPHLRISQLSVIYYYSPNMNRQLLLAIVFLIAGHSSHAQEISSFVSESGFGSTLLDSGVDIAYDSDGNIVIYGFFDEEVDFDPNGSGTIIDPLGSPDLFLAKYSAAGELIWVANIGRIALIDGVVNGQMAIDSDDNIVITGGFTSTVNFNPLGEPVTQTAEGGEDAFVAKYNSQGELFWVKKIGGNSTDVSTSLDIRFDNAIGLGFRFSGNVDVDPGENEEILMNAGALDAALVVLDSDGNYLHSAQIASPDNDNITAIAFSPDGKIAIGATINGATSGFPDRDMALSFHDFDGEVIWDYNYSNYDDANEISAISFSNDGLSIYIGGRINGTTDFDPDSENQISIDPVFADPFVAKYNLSGTLEWAKFVSSSGTNDYFASMAEAGSALIVLGCFDVEATFVEGDFSTQKQSAGGQDLFIAGYDAESGNYLASDIYGGSGDEFSQTAFFRDNGLVACTGSFSNTLNLDPAGEPIENVGFTDVFFAEFSFQTDLSDQLQQTALNQITIFPNPVSETLFLSLPRENLGHRIEYKIINVVGQEVKSGMFKLALSQVKLDVSDLAKGVFIMELNAGNQRISKRIIKQ
mgnify:CR=1 FL=1